MSTVSDLAPGTTVAADTELPRHPITPQPGAGATIPARPRRTRRTKTVARRIVSVLSTAMFVVAITAFVFLAVGPRVLGYQTSTMLTGSMAPLINPGDVVVTVPASVSGIRTGDIITYSIPVEDHRVETHRVTEVLTTKDGSTAVRTKGDANDGVDPWTATLNGATVDRHVLTIPYVGQAIRALRQPVLLNTLMYGAPALLVIGLLGSIWRKDPKPPASA